MALFRLTRARQKPGKGETPLLFSIHPKLSFRCQDHRHPIHHWAFIIFLPVQVTGGSNQRSSDHKPGILPCCHQRGISSYVQKCYVFAWMLPNCCFLDIISTNGHKYVYYWLGKIYFINGDGILRWYNNEVVPSQLWFVREPNVGGEHFTLMHERSRSWGLNDTVKQPGKTIIGFNI